VSGEEFEWVPLRDTATQWPGLLWWDVKGRAEEAGDDRG
jgi:hypothetical protein